jgi:catechol 2,3-dioxygenase-like lactoylglutathione lyase family enzyme
MKRILFLTLILTASLLPAQVAPPNEAGVSMGHLHLNVRDVEAAKRFWILLGAKPVKFGESTIMQIPGNLVFLRKAEPTGGSVGTVINHAGIRMKNVAAEFERLTSAGVKGEKGARWPQQAFMYSEDGLKVELFEDKTMSVPMMNHHVHFFVPEKSVTELQAWYVKTFGGVAAERTFKVVDFPGGTLTISGVTTPTTKTQGTALDHIGFEVKNLEEFCKKLEASGIKLDRPFTKASPQLSLAFFTDPWGTYIELTEGLNKF